MKVRKTDILSHSCWLQCTCTTHTVATYL